MTRRRKKPTRSSVVHVTAEIADDALYMALLEQLFLKKGPDSIARLMAARLRDPSPHRAVLDLVAQMLDPQGDFFLKLVVVPRGRGKPETKLKWTKRVNDVAIAKAVLHYQQELGNKYGSGKRAVSQVAELFAVSEGKVRKAMASK